MRQKVFIPVTDEMLYDHPETITAPLRPFTVGQPCFHWMGNANPGTTQTKIAEAGMADTAGIEQKKPAV